MQTESSKNLQSLYKDLGDTQTDVRNSHLYPLLTEFLYGKTLLDIGAGALHFMNRASKKGFDVEGIEPDKNLIKLGKRLYGEIGIVYNQPVEKIDKLGHKFDSISLIDVLEHIDNDTKTLTGLKTNLVPSGRLIVLVPAYQFLYSDRDRSIGHYRRYNKSDLERKLKRAGYEIIYSRYWNMLGFFVYLLFEKILKKRAPHHLRTKPKKNILAAFGHLIVSMWMRLVEKNINLGFGLSLLIVARKNNELHP